MIWTNCAVNIIVQEENDTILFTDASANETLSQYPFIELRAFSAG